MFACPSCLVSCLRAVAPDLGASLPCVRRPSSHLALDPLRWQRNYATAAPVAARRKGRGQKSARYISAPEERAQHVSPKPVPSSSDTALTAPPAFKPRHLRKELERLSDPLKLAENTKKLLLQGHEEKAFELVKLAGSNMSYVVSWNHLLDYNLERKDIQRAWKLFNEMKKRGQRPDAYTFTTMLDGLAENADSRIAMEKAESIYNSMYTPNSPVKPNTTHINAMLKVCSRARNFDKMFEVASQMPRSGRGAPTSATYVTILNALRASVEVISHAESAGHQVTKREQAAAQAKRIWADILQAWQSGSLQMDDKLVCAMGRVLLMSSDARNPDARTKQNADNVFSLVAQTMDIPRQGLSRIHGSRAHLQDLTEDLVGERDTEDANTDLIGHLDQASYGADGELGGDDDGLASPSSIFDKLPLRDGQIRKHARPSRDAVSMIMAACLILRAFREGRSYWSLLETRVEPDQENCHSYLRLLRAQRASSQAVDVVKKMVTSKAEGGYGTGVVKKTFTIAMSVCARDIKNPNMLKHALDIMNTMEQSLNTPTSKAIERFDELCTVKKRDMGVQTALATTTVLQKLLKRQQHRYDAFSSAVRQSKSLRKEDDQHEWNMLKHELPAISKIVESAIMRTMDTYSKEIEPKAHAELNKELTELRRWRAKRLLPEKQPSQKL